MSKTSSSDISTELLVNLPFSLCTFLSPSRKVYMWCTGLSADANEVVTWIAL